MNLLNYITEGFKIYRKNWLGLALSEIITFSISLVLVSSSLFIFFGYKNSQDLILETITYEPFLNQKNNSVLPESFSDLFKTPNFLKIYGTKILLSSLIYFLSILINGYFQIGKIGMAKESTTKKTNLITMFKVSRKYGLKWIWTNLILIILYLFLWIPGMIIFSFYPALVILLSFLVIPIKDLVGPAMIINKVSPIESIKKAVKSSLLNYFKFFILWILTYLTGSLFLVKIGQISEYLIFGIPVSLALLLVLKSSVEPIKNILMVLYYKENKI